MSFKDISIFSSDGHIFDKSELFSNLATKGRNFQYRNRRLGDVVQSNC